MNEGFLAPARRTGVEFGEVVVRRQVDRCPQQTTFPDMIRQTIGLCWRASKSAGFRSVWFEGHGHALPGE